MICFWCYLISSLFCCYKVNISMFHSFCIIHQLEKVLKLFFAFCLSLVFISRYGFSQAFWLNLITLGTFFKNNPWFKTCLEYLMWMASSDLLCKLVTSFSAFSIFILSGKSSKSLWISSNYPGYWILTSRKYLSLLSSL